MADYRSYGEEGEDLIAFSLRRQGFSELPIKYKNFMKLSHQTRKLIGINFPVALSDDYEHFMASLKRRNFAAQHVLIRKQIGGFTTTAGYWKWLEFLSHRITENEVLLMADFMSGEHNGYPRQFDKDYWLHVVHDYGGFLPIRIEYLGEGATFTGVPFPVAQIYGETPAVWVNEPMYIEIGRLSYVATIAGQIASILGDPFRFIEVAFRSLHNSYESDDVLLAMLIGGGIISTSNNMGALVNGDPFKCAGTTGHCYYQQFENFKDSLRALLGSPLGKYATALLDLNKHEHGFRELMEVIEEGFEAPFAERPDSGDILKLGLSDMMALQDSGNNVNVILEGQKTKEMLHSEKMRRQRGLEKERFLYGGGGVIMGQRKDLEPAYKACYFHDGTMDNPSNPLNTMKICLDEPMKQSIPGMVDCFFDSKKGFYTIGERGEVFPASDHVPGYHVLYDGLSNPGKPYFDPKYDPMNLTQCEAVRDGMSRAKTTRDLLGPSFTLDVEPNQTAIHMTQKLRDKKQNIYERALSYVGK